MSTIYEKRSIIVEDGSRVDILVPWETQQDGSLVQKSGVSLEGDITVQPAEGGSLETTQLLVKTATQALAALIADSKLPVSGTFFQSIQPSSDAGPGKPLTLTRTASGDMTSAADITPAPSAGEKIVAMDIWVSNMSDTDMNFTVQMETSGNVLAQVPLNARTVVPITLRGCVKGNVADKKLQGISTEAGNLSITVNSYSEV